MLFTQNQASQPYNTTPHSLNHTELRAAGYRGSKIPDEPPLCYVRLLEDVTQCPAASKPPPIASENRCGVVGMRKGQKDCGTVSVAVYLPKQGNMGKGAGQNQSKESKINHTPKWRTSRRTKQKYRGWSVQVLPRTMDNVCPWASCLSTPKVLSPSPGNRK